MYAVAAVGLVVYLVLFILSAKEAVGREKTGQGAFGDKEQGVFGIFKNMGSYLYIKGKLWKTSIFRSPQVEKNLGRLHPGANLEQLCRNYYVEKLAKSLLIGLAALILGVLLCYKTQHGSVLSEEGVIVRGNYLEEEKEISLMLAKEQVFPVTVEPRRLLLEEAEVLYQEFLTELSVYMLGENISADQIVENLFLPEKMEGYPFYVEWESGSPDLIGKDGELKEALSGEAEVMSENSLGQEVRLKAIITYEDMEWEEVFVVNVMPQTLTKEEKRYRDIEELLNDSLIESATKEEWILPREYNGETLIWKQVLEDNSLLLWVLGMVLAVVIFFLRDHDLQKEVEERKEMLRGDYPEILQKAVLYLGAGMTIRGAFRKLADDYLSEKERKGKVRPAMEEILYTCRELQAGIPEAQVYERFGKRTGVQEYIRFSTLLQQNLKKGNSTLLSRLREEADKAVLEKLQSSRRRSEEAVTKLLVPMVMMLLVVMVMIMIPAFSSTTL